MRDVQHKFSKKTVEAFFQNPNLCLFFVEYHKYEERRQTELAQELFNQALCHLENHRKNYPHIDELCGSSQNWLFTRISREVDNLWEQYDLDSNQNLDKDRTKRDFYAHIAQ